MSTNPAPRRTSTPTGQTDAAHAQPVARQPVRHRRTTVGVSALVVIALGLLVHVASDGPVGDFVADALYAVCLYLLVAFVLPRMRPFSVALIAVAACAAIELFQLTGIPAALADFLPFRLLLGTTFSAMDLVAYALGVLVALACDHGVRYTWRARHTS